MRPSYTPFVKTKAAETSALGSLEQEIVDRVLPIFEVDRPPAGKAPKYMSESRTPTIAYIDRALDLVGDLKWPGPIMVDTYQWLPDARVETGANVVSYVVSALRGRGATVIPVVGYDRWGHPEYREAMINLPLGPSGKAAIRLDHFAISDSVEPDLLRETVEEIVETLGLDPRQCAVLVDFGDVSGDSVSVLKMFEDFNRMADILSDFAFDYFAIAGCSLPPSIDLAVPTKDTDAPVLRKEMVVWQMLKDQNPDAAIVCSDYCVRGPTSTSAPVKHINGKIRYTIPRNHFVVRGHSRVIDGNFEQMYDLAERLVGSRHFLGENFSWGDAEIVRAADHDGGCGPTRWIEIDTSHHITHAVHEVLEFERVLVARAAETV